jgi:pimeloyl-ACP methyl ester carboxylesterase
MTQFALIKKRVLIILLFAAYTTFATEVPITLKTKTGEINGTLLLPMATNDISVALIIAGSGPTDRDGNNPMMKNNSLKMLAEELLKLNIATVRYDKRGIAESAKAMTAENDLRFETYINDAKEWIDLLKKDKRFARVIVVGHSEGSLIGMIAAQQAKADAFISVAGVGNSADIIIKTQLASQTPAIKDMSYNIIDSLLIGKTVAKVDPSLLGLFRPSVQPYLISWFKYNPQDEIKKLSCPILILHGTEDKQVLGSEAVLLQAANKRAQYIPIKGMNHIFKEGKLDNSSSMASYKDPNLPIMPEFTKLVSDFILDL